VTALCAAAARYDFAAMYALIDWPLSYAGGWARAVDSPALPASTSPRFLAQGFDELDRVTPAIAQGQLGEMALRLAEGATLRPATEPERRAVLGAIAIPRVERELPLKIVSRLDGWRRRAAAVAEVWVAQVDQRKVWLAISPDGPKLVVPIVTDPS
jgi:hypothetical protein